MMRIKKNIEYIVFGVLLIILVYLLSTRYFENFYTEQHGINRLDAIIYINLEDRSDRKDLLLKDLEALHTNMSKVHKVSGVYIPKNGHKGCIQSHILALNMIKLNKWKRVLILEDDAELTTDTETFNNIINKILDYLDGLHNSNWDVIMLATANKVINNADTTHNKILNISPQTSNILSTLTTNLKENTDDDKNKIKIEKITSATTSSAYIIKDTYVDKILDLFKVCNNKMMYNKLSSNNHEIYALDQQWATLQKQDNWFALSQDPIKQRNIWSTIMLSHK